MNETTILVFGSLVFMMLGGGIAMTIREFRTMGNRDQNDSYPRSRSNDVRR